MTADAVAASAASRVTPGKLLGALRAFSLPASVMPVVAAAAAALPAARWHWDLLAASVLGAALLHLAGNLLNDYFDFRYGVDRRTRDDDLRPGRLLVRGQLLPRHVAAEALACLALGLAIGAYVWMRTRPMALAFAAAAAVGLYAYTGPPLKLKYRALGEPTIFLLFGPLLMLGAAWVQTQRIDLHVLLLSLPVGLATTAILVGNNYRDRQEDDQARIRTLGHFAAGQAARITYLCLPPASVLILAAMGAAGAGPRLLIACPLALALLARPIRATLRRQRLPDIDAQTARFEMILLAWVIAAYVIGR